MIDDRLDRERDLDDDEDDLDEEDDIDDSDLDDDDLDDDEDLLDEVSARLSAAAADAPTIRPDGTFVLTVDAVCRRCGCSQTRGCPGGCVWAEPNLCSRCV